MIFLQECTVFYYKNSLIFIGPAGMTRVKVTKQTTNLQISISKEHINIQSSNETNSSIKFLTQMTLAIAKTLFKIANASKIKLLLFGVGFKSWTFKKNHDSEFIILKVGYSRDICVGIPRAIKVILLKPTLILLQSLDRTKLSQFVVLLRSLKAPDVYKGKGIRYIDETIILKDK